MKNSDDQWKYKITILIKIILRQSFQKCIRYINYINNLYND